MKVMPFPNPTDMVETVRCMCRHKVYDMEAPGFDVTIASSVICTDGVLKEGHMTGVVYNEETEFPYAVISDSDSDGEAYVVWDFNMDETDFGKGLLQFSRWVETKEWTAIAAHALLTEALSESSTYGLHLVEDDGEHL